MTDKQFKAKCQKNRDNKKRAKKFAKKNIQRFSKYELYFEAVLKILNVSYERQHIIPRGESFYLLDFYLPEYNLCFEIDGKEHEKNLEYDQQRDFFCLNKFAIVTHRIKNEQVLNVLPEVMAKVNSIIAEAHKDKEQINAKVDELVYQKMQSEFNS